MDSRFVCGAALAALGLLAGCSIFEGDGVKVSSFGYDPEDSTRFIQAALDSGAKKVILDRQAGPWNTLTLYMRSDTEFVVEPGVELVAKRGAFRDKRDYLFVVDGVTNVTIRGGAGSAFRMWKCDYQKPPYEKSEWRYALRIIRSANVLVEGLALRDSGGDGIGVSGRDITIRNCVCDNNHRQGISVFGVENLLIEDCILSNTKGTAHEAGIDFEPDTAPEGIVNAVMRNCVSKGNTGSGYDFFLGNLTDKSRPLSIRLENCRSVGNVRAGVTLNGNLLRTDASVPGSVVFENCSFEEDVKAGVAVLGVPRDAFDVTFSNCTISNAAPKAASDFSIGVGTFYQTHPDGIFLRNMRIYQPTNRPWFALTSPGVGPWPSRIQGDVTVVSPDGSSCKVALDGAWIRENFPLFNEGKPVPPRMKLPPAEKTVAVDAAPGELVDLTPCTLVVGARYVFFADRPGKVRFVGRQVSAVKGRPAETKRIEIADCASGRKWQVARPAFEDGEIAFDAPKRGFYTLTVPDGGTRFALVKSSVPVAVNLQTKHQTVAPIGGSPFSLFLDPAGARKALLVLGGDTYYRFAVSLTDDAGKKVFGTDLVESTFTSFLDGSAAKGLWRLDLSKGRKNTFDWVRLDLLGAPGAVFLTDRKYWR